MEYRDKNIFDLIVIGGGPAGMMAAGIAAERGAKVALIEKNKELGRKLSISGGGRCNIANAEDDVRELLSHYGEKKEFLFSPFSQFGVKDTFDFFEKQGLPLVVEARKRAFPHTHNAEDVTDTMEKYIRSKGVEIHLHTKVKSIEKLDEVFVTTTKKGNLLKSRTLIISCGGLAAPETGSTGDGFSFAKAFGHTVHEPNPNIVPLTTDARWVHTLSGITLSFMKISFLQKGKVKYKKTGKILFTHFGVSGPLILNAAHEVKKLLDRGPVIASIDMFPDTNEGDLEKRVLRLFDENKNKRVRNVFGSIIPQNIADVVLRLDHLDIAEKEVNSVTKEERKVLIHTLKNLQFPITGTMGFDWAVIADGGVPLEEVDTKSMESKKVSGLYLIGDTLHVNRPSGGYSLQLCWTTGFVAGSHIAEASK